MGLDGKKYIFYDPKQRRWHFFIGLIVVLSLLLAVILFFGGLGIAVDPTLPKLDVKNTKNFPAYNLVSSAFKTQNEKFYEQEKNKLLSAEKSRHNTQSSQASHEVVSSPNSKREVTAFYVEWDDTSFTALKANISNIDKLVCEWLSFDSVGGVKQLDPERQKRTLDFIRESKSSLKVVALINNYNSAADKWDGELLSGVLKDPIKRTRLVDSLYDFVKLYSLNGVNIDFEEVPESSQGDLLAFFKELYGKFHADNLEVSESVPVDNDSFKYSELAKYNDELMLMAYDEHWSSGEPGPIASESWFESVIKKRVKDIPADKLVIALGNYGYDWNVDDKGNASMLTFQESVRTAMESEAKTVLDQSSFNPYYEYYDENEKMHSVWFLDAVSVFNEVVFADGYHPKGYAVWRLGAEDPTVWQVFKGADDWGKIADRLSVLKYGYDIDYEGKGEILKVVSVPKDGVRKVTYDAKTSHVSNEEMVSYPSPYVIDRYGYSGDKKLVLSFDDGPDPVYTPKILDILKEKGVKAVFFVIGLNGDANTDLLKRIYDEGHEIGNHTFTHPNILNISDRHLRLELSSMQRLLQSHLGIGTLLFRPPYAEDVEPETPDQVSELVDVGNMGYYTVGMLIDPHDWASPGVDSIVNSTLSQVHAANGQVILLHDGGGDRSETLQALPIIIDKLKSEGYEFVSVSSLLNVKRDQIMPSTLGSGDQLIFWDEVTFSILSFLMGIVHFLFFIAIVFGVMRFVFLGSLALLEKRKRLKRAYSNDFSELVSIIVPAYNEEKVIVKTIKSILDSDYRNFEVIVVDDGSMDNTFSVVKKEFAANKMVKVFKVLNGGKSKALNYGISKAKGQIVIALDADTLFNKQTVGMLVRHFEDKGVGAVAGNAKVGNRVNILTVWQAVEYITSQNFEKRAFNLLNCITVVPGAVGAWRKELIVKVGGFTNDTLAEDADLTMSVLKMGYKIHYEDEALAYTEAPEKVSAFIKQRFRWMYGTYQVAWKHRDVFFRFRYGALGFVPMLNLVIFQIFLPLISPMMDLFMILNIVGAVNVYVNHPANYNFSDLKITAFYYILFLFIDFGACAVAFYLEKKEDWRLLLSVFIQKFFYRQLMYYVAIKSCLSVIKGKIVGWGKLDRTAHSKVG